MTKSNSEIMFNRFLIEDMVRMMIMQGENNNEKIVAVIDNYFHPKTEWEMEEYSEAILYGKYSVLN